MLVSEQSADGLLLYNFHLEGRFRLSVSIFKKQEEITMMRGDWMGGWGAGYMGGWGGLGMVLIVVLAVVGIIAIMRKK